MKQKRRYRKNSNTKKLTEFTCVSLSYSQCYLAVKMFLRDTKTASYSLQAPELGFQGFEQEVDCCVLFWAVDPYSLN
jgi:hypothetical protein